MLVVCYLTAKTLIKMTNMAIAIKVQHFCMCQKIGCSKICQNMPDLTNIPNQKYLCQPPRKNAKLKKFGIKICQLATLFSDSDSAPAAKFLNPDTVSSEISDLLLFVSYFASQNKKIKFGNYFFHVYCIH